jgi:hypothetical protein
MSSLQSIPIQGKGWKPQQQRSTVPENGEASAHLVYYFSLVEGDLRHVSTFAKYYRILMLGELRSAATMGKQLVEEATNRTIAVWGFRA